MGFNSLGEVFDAFKNQKVLIIGDVMIDAYIYGSVKRISPEAPVPVVNVQRRENRLGGAANVALNVQALGATPILCSIIGDDPSAAIFGELLLKRGITDRGIIRSKSRSTTVKNRVLSNNQQLLRVDDEIDLALSEIDRKSLINHILNLIDEVDVVIFEDYDKGCLDQLVIKETITRAKDKSVPTAVDPKKRNFNFYRGCTLFKPNLKELIEGTGASVDPKDHQTVTDAVRQLGNSLHFEKALITLSEYGVYYYSSGLKGSYPAHLRSISDVSGAGDTVISIAALCESIGLPVSFYAELANLGGGIVCEYPGVVPIKADRLYSEAEKDEILAKFD